MVQMSATIRLRSNWSREAAHLGKRSLNSAGTPVTGQYSTFSGAGGSGGAASAMLSPWQLLQQCETIKMV